MKQVVIIEDNKELLDFVAEIMQTKLGMAAFAFTNGASALSHLQRTKPDLVLIDLQLEDIHGEAICQQVRERYIDIPIIILTGDTSTDSIVNCLNAGADDYITKPFNVNELIARVNARMRAVETGANQNMIKVKDILMDQDTLEVTRGKEQIDLTVKEFELLRYLLVHKGMVLTRDKILAAVWGHQNLIDTRVVDVHVGKLRKKLDPDSDESVIRTVRGFGYKVVEA